MGFAVTPVFTVPITVLELLKKSVYYPLTPGLYMTMDEKCLLRKGIGQQRSFNEEKHRSIIVSHRSSSGLAFLEHPQARGVTRALKPKSLRCAVASAAARALQHGAVMAMLRCATATPVAIHPCLSARPTRLTPHGVLCPTAILKPPSPLKLQQSHAIMGGISALNGRGLGVRFVTRAVGKDSDSEIQGVKKNERGSLSHLELESSGSTRKKASFNGIFSLLLINFVAFAADHWLQLPFLRSFYLYHDYPRWYQFVTSTFIHASWAHLSSNLFFLYIFGKLVEEEEGSFAVWLSYIFTGVGANLVSWLILPRTVVSVGASGAVFGLFAISVLVKLSFDWRKILEVLILGQFVVEKVMEAAQASTQLAGRTYMGAANINHIAHLSGALVGVALIWMLNGITHLADKSSSK